MCVGKIHTVFVYSPHFMHWNICLSALLHFILAPNLY